MSGITIISRIKLSGLAFSPVVPLDNLNSQLRSNSISTILISLLAKNRPGQACGPWPKFRDSKEVETN